MTSSSPIEFANGRKNFFSPADPGPGWRDGTIRRCSVVPSSQALATPVAGRDIHAVFHNMNGQPMPNRSPFLKQVNHAAAFTRVRQPSLTPTNSGQTEGGKPIKENY
jgi:hypothetical protein